MTTPIQELVLNQGFTKLSWTPDWRSAAIVPAGLLGLYSARKAFFDENMDPIWGEADRAEKNPMQQAGNALEKVDKVLEGKGGFGDLPLAVQIGLGGAGVLGTGYLSKKIYDEMADKPKKKR